MSNLEGAEVTPSFHILHKDLKLPELLTQTAFCTQPTANDIHPVTFYNRGLPLKTLTLDTTATKRPYTSEAMAQIIHLCLLLGLSYLAVAGTCQQNSAVVDITEQLKKCFTQNSATNRYCVCKKHSSDDYHCCDASDFCQGHSVCLNVTNEVISGAGASPWQTITQNLIKACPDDLSFQYTLFIGRGDSCILTSTQSDGKVTVPGNCTIGTNRLQFRPEAKSWIDALEYCRSNRSSLVQLNNTTVNDTVKQLLLGAAGLQTGVWIGLERTIFTCNPSGSGFQGQCPKC
ncbi:hypothetical protein Q5P01_010106 [Channa striata]|uniref:C-type lectin domain-containing protein n=1 Tax=Channa striata TaxID=64152 RepID=A0AA88SY26_CHASR|nr:hypothetical protein Q5P01_010106 [Channa striata]